jgi:hypothetical protein
MKAFFKYAIVLSLGLAVGFIVNGPLNLDDVAKLKWLDQINVIINKAFVPAKSEADVVPIDPAAAALVDEDLDYRIAQRIGSLEGWRSFLAAHGSGAHAQSARAEAQVLAGKAPAEAAAEVSNSASTDAKAASEVVPSAPPSPGTEVAALATDEICNRDGDRLERLRGSPASDEAARFANELRCEKLRPQLVALMESFGYTAPTQAAAPPIPPVKDGPALSPKWRATGPPSRMRWTASSRSLQPRRHANGCAFKSACFWRAATLPPILLALIGARPKNSSAFGHTLAHARSNDLRGR